MTAFAIYLDKRMETVEAIFGTSCAGGVFVPINPVLRPQQVGYILRDCDVKVLVTSHDRAQLLASEIDGTPSLEHVVVVDSPASSGALDWSRLMDSTATPIGTAARGIDTDIAAILYTSGSTGQPKGVVLSHRNLIVGAESVSSYLGNNADDVILSALPISFDAGLSQLTTAFSVGAQVVLVNFLLPADIIKACARHRVTGLTAVPPLWIQIADRPWPAETRENLRYFANTGGRMPKTTLDTLRLTFPNAKPFLMYGLTEAFRSTYLDPEEVDRRPDSIGKAIPNAEILVVRPDGTPCDAGEEGELVHRGALVALGYWNDPERTAARFRPVPGHGSESWRTPELAVWSGDTVMADDEGFLYFVGRRDDMIKSSGYRISPTEIEEAVYDTGLVRDVVALGVEDDELGQRIVVMATPRSGTSLDIDGIQNRLRTQIPMYMLPSEIIERDELPRSPNGKFDRNILRSELSQ